MSSIQNSELLERLARFPTLYVLRPVVVSTGQLNPASFSRGIFGDPAILKLMAREFLRLVDFQRIDVIAGIELQGVPLATALGLESGKPSVIVRERAKRPGRPVIIGDIDFLRPGTRTLLVDDMLAFGGTKEQRTLLLEECGARVTGIAAFVRAQCVPPASNRPEHYDYDGMSWIAVRGIPVYALIEHEELVELQERAGTVTEELASVLCHATDGPYWEDAEHLRTLVALFRRTSTAIEPTVAQYIRDHGVDVS